MRIAICDDEAADLAAEYEIICSVLDEKGVDYTFDKFSDPSELLAADGFDIAFLDVEMDGMTGIDLARRLHEINKDCLVFFITNYSVYLDSAFDVNAIRYLTKPIDRARLSSGIDSAIERIETANKKITLTDFKTKCKTDIFLSDMIYIETVKRRTKVVTVSGAFEAAENFTEIKSAIESEVNYFATPHQSYFVNLKYVTGYDKLSVHMTYGENTYSAMVSRRLYKAFAAKMFKTAKDLR